MLSHCRARRHANTAQESNSRRSHPSSSSSAACAQDRGFSGLDSISTTRRRVVLPSASTRTPLNSNPVTQPPAPPPASLSSESSSPPISQPTAAELQAQEEEEISRDLLAMRKEFNRYLSKPLYGENAPLDLVRHWDVSESPRIQLSLIADLMRYRNPKKNSHFSSRSALISYLSKRQRYHARDFSLRVKKLALFAVTSCRLRQLRFCRF
jgi:hypothetical protein